MSQQGNPFGAALGGLWDDVRGTFTGALRERIEHEMLPERVDSPYRLNPQDIAPKAPNPVGSTQAVDPRAAGYPTPPMVPGITQLNQQQVVWIALAGLGALALVALLKD